MFGTHVSAHTELNGATVLAVARAAQRGLLLANFTGVKRLSDGPLKKVTTQLPDLRVFVAKSANHVSDELLAHINDELQDCVVINYYGDRVGADEGSSWGATGCIVSKDGFMLEY